MAVSPTPLAFNLTAGVLVGLGLSGASFTIVIAALGRLVPADRSSQAMGLATAAGSLGQFVFAPLGQAFLTDYGWQAALLLLAGCMVVVPALAVALKGGGVAGRAWRSLLCPPVTRFRQAFGHGSYLLLVAGFFVCGFHVAFITTHLPAHISAVAGHSHGGMHTAGPSVAAWALALIGLFNIVGSYGSGCSGRTPQQAAPARRDLPRQGRRHSGFHYPASDPGGGARLCGRDGVLWLSTVPLTSGLVAVMFGTRNLGTLFGIVFLSHQIGAFLGVWLGGLAFEQTGSFMPIWWAGIVLAIVAAGLHWPIVERPAPSFAASAHAGS